MKEQNFIKIENLISTKARKKHFLFCCMYYQIFEGHLGKSSYSIYAFSDIDILLTGSQEIDLSSIFEWT